MNTKKNLAKLMLMSILTAGTTSAFTSCSNDMDDMNNAMTATVDNNILLNLEQYSYSVPVNITNQGDWKVDIKFDDENNHFCYALPDHGHGPATIKLCMLDNWTNERNSGELVITDLQNPSNSKTLRLGQKCNLDDRTMTRGAETQSPYSQGLRNKAVGYGYNTTMVPGYDAVSTNPIIALEKLAESGNDAGAKIGGCSGYNEQTSTGKTYNELFSNVKAEANGKATMGGLTAELKSSYSTEQKHSTTDLFVYRTIDVKVANVYLSGIDRNNIRDFLTDNARNAINGGGVYTSDNQGFSNLVKDYGSHLILKCDLGGRMRYASTVSKTLTSSTDEATAFASLSYKNKIMDAGSNVNTTLKNTYERNTSKVHTSIKALGGDPTLANIVNEKTAQSRHGAAPSTKTQAWWLAWMTTRTT